MVELDVRRTADGELVVHHDATLDDGRADRRSAGADLPDWLPSSTSRSTPARAWRSTSRSRTRRATRTTTRRRWSPPRVAALVAGSACRSRASCRRSTCATIDAVHARRRRPCRPAGSRLARMRRRRVIETTAAERARRHPPPRVGRHRRADRPRPTPRALRSTRGPSTTSTASGAGRRGASTASSPTSRRLARQPTLTAASDELEAVGFVAQTSCSTSPR